MTDISLQLSLLSVLNIILFLFSSLPPSPCCPSIGLTQAVGKQQQQC